MSAFSRFHSLRGSVSEAGPDLAQPTGRPRAVTPGPLHSLLSAAGALFLVAAAVCLCFLLPRSPEEE